jgi:hypothetical protein
MVALLNKKIEDARNMAAEGTGPGADQGVPAPLNTSDPLRPAASDIQPETNLYVSEQTGSYNQIVAKIKKLEDMPSDKEFRTIFLKEYRDIRNAYFNIENQLTANQKEILKAKMNDLELKFNDSILSKGSFGIR